MERMKLWKFNYLLIKNKFRYWLLKNSPAEMEEHLLAKKHLQLLEPKLFKKIEINKACLYLMDINFTSYKEIIKITLMATSALKGGMKVDANLIQLTSNTMTIEQFFMDENLVYIDAEKAVERIKEISIEFLNCFDLIKNEKVGIEGYNNRVLIQHVRALNKVSAHLREYIHG